MKGFSISAITSGTGSAGAGGATKPEGSTRLVSGGAVLAATEKGAGAGGIFGTGDDGADGFDGTDGTDDLRKTFIREIA